MPKGNPKPKNLFTSENQPVNKGRKKSVLKQLAIKSDLNSDDISDLIKIMFEKTEDELKEMVEDKNQPFLLRAFARAFFDDVQQGRLYNITTMLDRAIGKVTDKVNVTFDTTAYDTLKELYGHK